MCSLCCYDIRSEMGDSENEYDWSIMVLLIGVLDQ